MFCDTHGEIQGGVLQGTPVIFRQVKSFVEV